MFDQQRAQLEKLGYTIVSQSEDELVAVRQKWYWDCIATSLTLVVFLRAMGSLGAADIEGERERMIAQARDLDPSRLPLGLQKGRAVIAAYLADKVELDAQQLCSSSQRMRFATFFFPAALDQSSGQAYYLRKTPIWGNVYFDKLRYVVQHLIDPASAPEREPISVLGSITLGFIVGILALLVWFIFFLALLVQ